MSSAGARHANRGGAGAKALILAAAAAVIAFFALQQFRAPAIVAEVRRGVAVDAVPGSIEVHADKDLQELKVEGSGRVIECARLEPGRFFMKDEVLLKLDVSDIERTLEQAKRRYDNAVELAKLRSTGDSNVRLAQQNLDNARELFRLGGASQENVDAAQRAFDAAMTEKKVAEFTAKKEEEDYKEAVKAGEVLKNKMVVTAPTDGMVEGAPVSLGALVSAGAVVATFYANERVVVAKISEEDIAKVKIGDSAKVQLLTFPGRDFEAKVMKILPFADAGTRRFNVYLEVKAALSELLPNSTGEVTITVGQHDGVPLVARRAIFNGINGLFVFVVQDGRVERRQVEIGYRDLTTAEVTRGLAPGDRVIVENLDQFRDGQRVQVEPAP